MSRSYLERIWYPAPELMGRSRAGRWLAPLEWIYRSGQALSRKKSKIEKVDRPVISVGNLTVGGSGKTPLVIELVRLLEEMGLKVAIVSRGYRRKGGGIKVVHGPGGEPPSFEEAGDEPALLSIRCPRAGVVVGADRVAAARLAIEQIDPAVIVCDDAFQHTRLNRQVNILAVHAQRGFGNGHLLPRGPLREPLSAIHRATLVIFTYAKGESAQELRRRHKIPSEIPAIACSFVPIGLVSAKDFLLVGKESIGAPMLGVCAIANASGFDATCQEAGLQLADRLAFPDHHAFTAKDIQQVEQAVEKHRCTAVVATEKDLVRFRDLQLPLPLLGLRIEARWNQESDRQTLVQIIQQRLDKFFA